MKPMQTHMKLAYYKLQSDNHWYRTSHNVQTGEGRVRQVINVKFRIENLNHNKN